RRQARERQAGAMRHQQTGCERAWQELEETLDQALANLPGKYREAIVLCCLEGKTQEEAARQGGCSRGAPRGRRAGGGELLRQQLARRGVSFSAGALATFLTASAASAALPAAVLCGIVRTSLGAATGTAAVGSISPRVAALTEGVTKAMLLTRAKSIVALFVVLAVLAA